MGKLIVPSRKALKSQCKSIRDLDVNRIPPSPPDFDPFLFSGVRELGSLTLEFFDDERVHTTHSWRRYRRLYPSQITPAYLV